MNYITFNEIIEVNRWEIVHAKDGMRRCIRLWRSILEGKGRRLRLMRRS